MSLVSSCGKFQFLMVRAELKLPVTVSFGASV